MKVKADLVPKHYTVNATLGENDMVALIVELGLYVTEFEAGPQMEQLFTILRDAYAGDLPQASSGDAEAIAA